MKVAIITASTAVYKGEQEDASGKVIRKMVEEAGLDVVFMKALPTDKTVLSTVFQRMADGNLADLILTTGGTGFAPRDMTPEATNAVCDRMANGIADAIRNYSMTITDRAMFSRAVSGLRKKTLIINLPGSPKAVTEALEYILPKLPHGLDVLRGNVQECGRK